MEADTASNTGVWVSAGSVGAICGVIGAWIKSKFARKVEVTPNPMQIEQTANQAKWKENDAAHENLFNRVGKVEQTVAGLIERDHAQDRVIDRMANQVDKLYDRIIGGKKK